MDIYSIEDNLYLGTGEPDFNAFDNIVIISFKSIIIDIYGLRFETPPNITTRALARFIFKCWNQELTKEQFDMLDIEGDFPASMCELFPTSGVAALVRQNNSRVYTVELND